MKMLKFFLLTILALAMCMACSDKGVLEQKTKTYNDNVLSACTARTDDVVHYLTDYKTTILKEFPQQGRFSVRSCIVVAKQFDDTEPTAYLVEGFTTRRICNYPQYAKEWDLPENGLPILLSGKVYPPSFNYGFQPAVLIFHDLELTTLKRELK
jgi:hypothetical protein